MGTYQYLPHAEFLLFPIEILQDCSKKSNRSADSLSSLCIHVLIYVRLPRARESNPHTNDFSALSQCYLSTRRVPSFAVDSGGYIQLVSPLQRTSGVATER